MNKLFPIVLALLFFSCDEDNPVASDTTAPIVTITYPVNNATLSAQTTVLVNVVDDSDITSVVFLVNGTETFTDTEAPFEYSWDVCAISSETPIMDSFGDMLTGSAATILVNAIDSNNNIGVSQLITYNVGGEYDECSVCGGDNSTCTDECGVVNGDNSTCTDCSGVVNGSDIDCGGACDENVELWGQCYNIETTTELSLFNYQYTGEIPSSIGNLTNLTYLNLGLNELTGEIPSSIGNLTNLTYLRLSSNELTGEIPPEIGNLTNLHELSLTENQLTGEIPLEIGNLTNLHELHLHNNQLSGEIPAEIGNLTNLTYLILYSNELTGQIPPEIGNLTNLVDLNLYNNEFSGEIPSSIVNLTNLTHLYLSNNQLIGEIPSEICQVDSTPSVGNNNFCPPYPSCISQYNIDTQDTSNCP